MARIPDEVSEAGRRLMSSLEQENADLGSLLEQAPTEPYPPTRRGWPATLTKTMSGELPKRITDRLASSQSDILCCYCGAFPQIRRAWATLDQTLFLWRFDRPNDAPLEYNEEQVICAVELVRPRPGIFIESIEYLLVVATPVEIVLLGVCTSGGSGGFDELTLQPLPLYTLPSDDVVFRCIKGTQGGRIFLGGQDGHLYELSYSTSGGWNEKRCQKVCHSGLVQKVMPSFLKLGSPDPILEIAIDEHRQILYTRSQGSALQVYHILKGQARKVADCHNVRQAASTVPNHPYGWETSNEAANKQLAIVALIPIEGSRRIQLCTVTRDGHRLFWTTYPSSGYFGGPAASDGRPSGLKCLYLRSPPLRPDQSITTTGAFSDTIRSIQTNIPTTLQVEAAFYAGGLLLLSAAPSAEGSSGRLVCASLDVTDPGNSRGLRETVAELPLVGTVLAIGEVVRTRAEPSVKDRVASWKAMNELSTQHELPRRQFVLVGTAGVLQIEKWRPIDLLQSLLEDGEMSRLEEFFKAFGTAEAAAMCLLLATGSPNAVESNPRLSEQALRVFEDPTLRGLARVDDTGISSQGTVGEFNMGRAVPRTEDRLVFSGAYTGAYLQSSRMLRSLWTVPLAHKTKGKQPVFKCSFASKHLGDVESRVRPLERLLARYPNLRGQYGGGTSSTGVGGSAKRLRRDVLAPGSDQVLDATAEEERRMAALASLLTRSAEALKLLQMMSERDFNQLVNSRKLRPEQRERLTSLTFSQLAVSAEGNEIARVLIEALLEISETDTGSTIERITSDLRKYCPSFYGEEDRCFHRAQELLLRASNALISGNGSLSQQLSSQAVEALLTIPLARNIPLAVRKLEAVQCYEGVVELAMRRAGALLAADEMNHELMIEQHPASEACYGLILEAVEHLVSPPAAPLAGQSASQQLNDSDGIIVIGQADRVRYLETLLNACLRHEAPWSANKTFHQRLYSYMVQLGLKTEILHLDRLPGVRGEVRFLEGFLKEAGGGVVDAQTKATITNSQAEYLEILAKLYAQRRQFTKAGIVFLRLAERQKGPDARDLTLIKRYELMSTALVHAKSQPGAVDVELVERLEGKLGVLAFQQRAQRILEDQSKHEPDPQLHQKAMELSEELVDISTLYNTYTFELRLWGLCIEILDFAHHSDEGLVKGIWDSYLVQDLPDECHGALAEACKRAQALGATLWPREVSFPLEHVAMRLETLAGGVWPHSGPAVAPDSTVVVDALVAAVKGNAEPLHRAYEALLIRRGGQLHAPSIRIRLLHGMTQILTKWIAAVNAAPRTAAASVALTPSGIQRREGAWSGGDKSEVGRLRELCEQYALEARRLNGGDKLANELSEMSARLSERSGWMRGA